MSVKTLFIIGPTASGKTGLSEKITQHLSCEIINADIGQFYTPLSIGTAKPDYQKYSFPAHLFDILDEPEDLSVVQYRRMAVDIIKKCFEKKHRPIVVGGAFFYIKSLFFPLKEFSTQKAEQSRTGYFSKEMLTQELWDQLFKIDSKRAKQIHSHDRYRIARALDIWEKTGKKPSEYAPEYAPVSDSLVVVLLPDKKKLEERIILRTAQMVRQEGWIDEAKKIIDTKWEPFVIKKGLIGYEQLFEWIRNGGKEAVLDEVIKNIQVTTLQYAKRQRTFIRGFIKLLEQHQHLSPFSCDIMFVESVDQTNVKKIIDAYNA